jgi:hypothetical protein
MALPEQQRSGVGKFFLGTPAQTIQLDKYNPQQQDLINRSASMASGMLGNASFDPYERQARQQFSQQTVPGLAERFTSMGGRGSSAFGQQLGSAAAGLESNLATGRADYDRNLLQQLLGTGLTQQFDSIYQPEQSGFLANTANALGEALPRLGMAYMTGGLSELGGMGGMGGQGGINLLGQLLGGLSGQGGQMRQQGPMSQENNLQNIAQLLSGGASQNSQAPMSNMSPVSSGGAMQQQLPWTAMKSPQGFGNSSSIFGQQSAPSQPALMQLLSALQNQQGSGIPWKKASYL